MMSPIKYLESKLLIFSRESEKRDSVFFGIIVMMPFFNNLLSYIKKNKINKTEKSPALKSPNPSRMILSMVGISFN